jgi:subtilisin family serine protease
MKKVNRNAKRLGLGILTAMLLFFIFSTSLSREPSQRSGTAVEPLAAADGAKSGPAPVFAPTEEAQGHGGALGRAAADVRPEKREPRGPDKSASAQNHPYADQEILVQFSPRISRDEIIALLNSLDMSIAQVLGKEVVFSEPNFIVHTSGAPNDPSYALQWAMHNGGQTGGTADADIDAAEAWNRATGSDGVIVAVVDEGIDLTHPDLGANVWVNPGEIAGNDLDDDGNGYIDDVRGWDFYHGDASVYDDPSEDRIIGAVGNNGAGVAGVCWTVRLMPVKFIAYGSGTVADAIAALHYAADNGAQVVNCSWGGTSYSQSLEAAFRALRDAGVLVVASAGNSAQDTDSHNHYPSNYDLANIVSVAATDKHDALSGFSNYGLSTVDLGAPGSAIYTTVPGGNYANFYGTSAAAPFVTGAAALALSVEPGLSYLDVKDHLLNSVDPMDSLTGMTVTGGRLNLNNLIGRLEPGDTDGDGMPDGFEIAHGLDPDDPDDATADADDDGLSNLDEYRQATSPLDPDTDDDGMPDGFEVSWLLDPTTASDASSDSDGDGLSNLVEYRHGMRIDAPDSDGDGLDDFTEFGSYEAAADSDGDGLIDPLDPDADNDGKPDAQEGVGDADGDGAANYVDRNDADGPEGDQDGDGLENGLEVSFMFYPNLADSDGDGIDDRTEFGPGAAPRDSDQDGVPDGLDQDSDNDGTDDEAEGEGDADRDNVPDYRDGDDRDGPWGDADGDGLRNGQEAAHGLNVNVPDSDGDGLDDLTEFGTAAEPADTDGDGLVDAIDPDSDNDGAPDSSEGDADMDDNGVPDRLDGGAATVSSDVGAISLTIEGADGSLEEVVLLAQAVAESTRPNMVFPYGGLQYRIIGLEAGATVSLTIRTDFVLAANAEFWKYDPIDGYYRYPAVIGESSVQFSLTDGAVGDEDRVADGVILDPGYIGVPVASERTAPVAASGGGGGGGCALAQRRAGGAGGLADLVVLMLPLGILAARRS